MAVGATGAATTTRGAPEAGESGGSDPTSPLDDDEGDGDAGDEDDSIDSDSDTDGNAIDGTDAGCRIGGVPATLPLLLLPLLLGRRRRRP